MIIRVEYIKRERETTFLHEWQNYDGFKKIKSTKNCKKLK